MSRGTVYAVPKPYRGTAEIVTREPEIPISMVTSDSFFFLYIIFVSPEKATYRDYFRRLSLSSASGFPCKEHNFVTGKITYDLGSLYKIIN